MSLKSMVKSFLEVTDRGRPLTRSLKIGQSKTLSPTIFSFLPKDELILINKGKLYFLSFKETSLKAKLSGMEFFFIESESLLEIEQDYLKSNSKYIKAIFDSITQEIKSRESVSERIVKNFESSFQGKVSLDSIIKNYFYPATKRINVKEILKNVEKFEHLQKESSLKSLKDINLMFEPSLIETYLNQKYGKRPLLYTGGKISPLDNQKHLLEDLNKLNRDYKTFLSNKIKNLIEKDFENLLDNAINKNSSILKTKNQLESIVSSPHPSFGADKISDNEYILFKKVESYGVEYGGSFYLFPPTKVGLGISMNGNGCHIQDRGFIYDDPSYAHPYVEGAKGKKRRSICTAGNHSKILNKLSFEENAGLKTINAMNSAIGLLDSFENILKRGHNSGHIPAHGDSVEKSAKKLSRHEAERLKKKEVEFFLKIT